MRAMTMMGIAAALVFTTGPVAAQRGGPGGIGMDGDRARAGSPLERQVERALARRDALGLTEAQVAQLEALRSDIEEALEPLRAEGRSLRSEARDRSGEPEEVRARMQDLRVQSRGLQARNDTVVAGLQQRFEQAVPPLQRRELAQSGRADRRAGEARRAGRRGAERALATRGASGRADIGRRSARARGVPDAGLAGRRGPAAARRGPAVGMRGERAWPGRDARSRRIGWRLG